MTTATLKESCVVEVEGSAIALQGAVGELLGITFTPGSGLMFSKVTALSPFSNWFRARRQGWTVRNLTWMSGAVLTKVGLIVTIYGYNFGWRKVRVEASNPRGMAKLTAFQHKVEDMEGITLTEVEATDSKSVAEALARNTEELSKVKAELARFRQAQPQVRRETEAEEKARLSKNIREIEQLLKEEKMAEHDHHDLEKVRKRYVELATKLLHSGHQVEVHPVRETVST